MFKWFLRRQIARFERTWHYDASYLRELIEIDPWAVQALGKLQSISNYRRDVPPAVWAAAGIVSVMTEDCGPCTQLGIDMAERGGVDPSVLRAVVARDFAAMPDEVASANPAAPRCRMYVSDTASSKDVHCVQGAPWRPVWSPMTTSSYGTNCWKTVRASASSAPLNGRRRSMKPMRSSPEAEFYA